MTQKSLFGEPAPRGPLYGKAGQRLFVPKLLTEAAMNFDKPTPERDRAFETIKKWAELESTGKLARRNETKLEGEFFADVLSGALGYTNFAQNLPEWDLQPKFPVDGQTADGAIGYFRDDGANTPRVMIELKGPKCNIDRDRSRGRTPVQQCWDYLNLATECPWGLVCNYVGFRLYHRTRSPRNYEDFLLRDLVQFTKFREFYFVFERGGFLRSVVGQPPRCDELLQKSEIERKEVGAKLYELYHEQRVALINHLRRGPHHKTNDDAIYIAQKLLDRVIFIAFCQNRKLLPESTLERAWRDVPAFALATNPRWENFKHLFRSVDQGNKAAEISAFNGGLFRPDPKVDDLQLNDEWTNFFREIGTYDFKDNVSLDVLGHLFEQSISDLEVLRSNPEAAEKQVKKKPAGKRKREGIYYTPEFITKYIVQATIGPCLRERFAALAEQLKVDPFAPAEQRDPAKWRKYQLGRWEIITKLRVCDPACGSGAFLNQALEYLDDWYADVVTEVEAFDERLAEDLAARISETILKENLFGVDLSQEAVEITRLSLWIRTAEREKTLADLSHNIQWGNSVVTDPEVHPKAFDWQAAFPEVFAAGGFDVIVGNPPYIRQEWIAPYKPYWETKFQSFHGVADIFTYFFERGLQVLRDGGRLAFITSGSWVRGNFGGPLRKFIAENSGVESLIDFGEYQPFPDAEMIRPSITVLRKKFPGGEMKLFKWLTTGTPPENLAEVMETAPLIKTSHFDEKTWELETDEVIELKKKLSAGRKTLLEYTEGKMYRGLVTGLNEVFVISSEIRNDLVKKDPRSAEILKPFVQGTHLRPWYVEKSDSWLIFTRRGIDIDQYPAVRSYLTAHRAALEAKPDDWPKNKAWDGRKPGGYQWYEVQDPIDYWQTFEEQKIFWPDISKLPRFSMDDRGLFIGNTGFIIPGGDYYLLGVLSSWATWFFISKTAQPLRLRGGRWQYRLFAQFMEQIPIPNAKKSDRERIAKLAQDCCRIGIERYEIQAHVQHRLLTTFAEPGLQGPLGTLNEKAQAWWEQTTIDLGAALKTSFKLTTNPLKSPRVADEWESYLAEKRAAVEQLTRQLADAEAELNDRVYRLFQLSPAEIALLQREVAH